MGWMQSEQARRVAIAVLLALGLAIVATAFSGSGPDTAAGRLGGDYSAFYAAGRIAADDGLEHVNDLAHLEAAQVDLYPADEAGEGFLTWPYPPHVALAYAPLTALPYRPSYFLHTAFMVAVFCGAVLAARPLLPWLRRAALPAIAVGLAFYPMQRGIGSGQNTALTLALLVLAWRATHAGRDGWAGLFLGLQLFKPQYAAVATLGYLAAGRWRILPTFAATGVATWILAAVLAGPNWVSNWLHDLSTYRGTEDVNAPNHVSLAETSEALIGSSRPGRALAAVVVLLFVRHCWTRGRLDFRQVMLALPPTALLVAPHAVFYDVGLTLISAAILLQLGRARVVLPLLVLGFVDPLKEVLDWNPGCFVVVAWLVVALTTPGDQPAVPASVGSSSNTEVT